jgi:hypothetical protein
MSRSAFVSRHAQSLFVCALALAVLLPAAPLAAWGREGHQIIAQLAETELSPAARAEVDRLLANEDEPGLVAASTWADEIRDSPEWRHTVRWHWVNLPRTNPCTYEAARDCAKGQCIVGAIEAQLAVLSDASQPDAERAIALKFVAHFIGDVHQPFHAGFSDDRGGNSTQLRFDRQGWNLHSLWDSAMVRHADLSSDAYARQLRGGPALPPDAVIAVADRPKAWAVESCQAIHDHDLYPERRAVGRGYLDAHRGLAEQRLRQAGNRLAEALESALVE